MKRLLWLMYLSFALALSPAPAYSLNDGAAGAGLSASANDRCINHNSRFIVSRL